jgi:hypothetical protein
MYFSIKIVGFNVIRVGYFTNIFSSTHIICTYPVIFSLGHLSLINFFRRDILDIVTVK